MTTARLGTEIGLFVEIGRWSTSGIVLVKFEFTGLPFCQKTAFAQTRLAWAGLTEVLIAIILVSAAP